MEIAPISEPWAGTAQISYLTYGISSSSADKDKTMQCLDYLYGNADILNLLNWGEEGVDYEVVDAENNIINYRMEKMTATRIIWQKDGSYLTSLKCISGRVIHQISGMKQRH